MRNLLTSIIITISWSAYAQISIDTTSLGPYDTSDPDIDLSQLLGAADSVTTSSLVFDTITKNDFNKYKNKYHSKIVADSSSHIWTDTSFIINTKNWKRTFNTRVTDNATYNYYQGFLEPLNLFIVLNVDGHNELGTLLLIDKITGKQFYVSSGYDYPCETVYISPKNNYLLSYANNWAENNQCNFTIFKIVRTKKHFSIKGFNGYTSSQWTIDDIAWINDNSIALSVKEKVNPNDYDHNSGISHYFKASFDK